MTDREVQLIVVSALVTVSIISLFCSVYMIAHSNGYCEGCEDTRKAILRK